ncbi:hypothetical protein MKX01_019873 [Papaver californicum]|nr:hypothetical protein MKX01_019873 [Papaver californicum]
MSIPSIDCKVILPVMDDLMRALCKMAKDNAHVPMLSRTHGSQLHQLLWERKWQFLLGVCKISRIKFQPLCDSDHNQQVGTKMSPMESWVMVQFR